MTVLDRTLELEKKANAFGFQWENATQILDQIKSECQEIQAELDQKNTENLQEEIGDLLHAVLSLCVFCQFPLQATLEKSLDKFDGRLAQVIAQAKSHGYQTLKGQPIDVLMSFWNKAKETKNGK